MGKLGEILEWAERAASGLTVEELKAGLILALENDHLVEAFTLEHALRLSGTSSTPISDMGGFYKQTEHQQFKFKRSIWMLSEYIGELDKYSAVATKDDHLELLCLSHSLRQKVVQFDYWRRKGMSE